MTVTVELMWPPKELHPNARVHFRTKAQATKLYRDAAFWTAKMLDFEAPGASEMTLRCDFHPPDKRRRDIDGMLSSIKAGIDGIADAMLFNDHCVHTVTLHRGEPIKGGLVRVRVMAQ